MRASIFPAAAFFGLACIAGVSGILRVDSAAAQQGAPSSDAVKQIQLTDKQVEGVLAANTDMNAIFAMLPEGSEPDQKAMRQLDGVAKKYGFKDYADYDDVTSNVNLVMGGFDPATKKYVGPDVVLKQQIAEVQADKKMSAKDKKEALSELNNELKSAAPLQFPQNATVVGKYYEKLSEIMSQERQ
jgi:hypothetical protein